MIKTASLFSQLLRHFPRMEFQRLVNKHKAEYRAKGFTDKGSLCYEVSVSHHRALISFVIGLFAHPKGISCGA